MDAPKASTAPAAADRARAVAVPVVLLALAAVLWRGPWEFDSPVTPPVRVPTWATHTAPIRTPKLAPEIELAGFRYQCNDCHRLFRSPAETDRRLAQHTDIVLKHGINTRCFNCHHRDNRNAFVDDAGGEIPYDQPQLLCARCHGTVYRDWQHGVHGRTNGYWAPAQGPAARLRCIQCHDPHEPPFPPMVPAPGPRTLRMGVPGAPAHDGTHNPLRVYRRAAAPDEPAPHGPAPEKQP